MKVKVYQPAARPAPVRDILTFCVPSSDGKRTYRVHQLPDGRWSCTCPDFEHRGVPGYKCKHVRAIMAKSAQEVPVEGAML